MVSRVLLDPEDELTALRAQLDSARKVIERYGDKDMWEYTYSKRLGGSCGDIHCPNHVCTKSEFMSKYDGYEIAQKWLAENKTEDK